MSKLILNNKIAKNIFNDSLFKKELIEALNVLIDEELCKDDGEISFELIDMYSEALNKIYSGEDIEKIFMSLQTVKEMQELLSSDNRFVVLRRTAKITLAACAVIAVTLGVNTVTEKATGYDLLGSMASAVKSFFTGEVSGEFNENTETTEKTTYEDRSESVSEGVTEKVTESVTEYTPVISLPSSEQTDTTVSPSVSATQNDTETTTRRITPQNPNLSEVLSPESTTKVQEPETTTREAFTRPPEEESKTNAPVIIKLTGTFSGDFKKNYTVGESADFTGLTVSAHYDNGEEKVIPIENCNIYGFSTATPANRIVTVEYEGCSFSFLIRVYEEG